MPKDVAPRPAQPQYDGFRWLGSQWGRSGKPTSSRVSGGLMLAAAVIVSGIASNGAREDASMANVVGSIVVGAGCLIAAGFYFIEAHFAGRALREQEPKLPASELEPPTTTETGVGPHDE